jgi:hypothetical protein
MSIEFSLKVTDIAEYIRYQSCDRRFKLKYDKYKQVRDDIPSFSQLIFNTSLDPVLEAEGRKREEDWAKSLDKEGFNRLIVTSDASGKESSVSWDDFTEKLANLAVGEKAYGREIAIAGKLGEFNISGQIDFILIYWQDNQPFFRLVECKASRKDRTYHRVQVAVYQMLLRELMKSHPITISGVKVNPQNIECVVVRIDENTNQIQDIIKSPALNLDSIEADIERLIASDGSLKQIIEKDIDDLDYQLDQKCSDCILSVHCLAESARKKSLQLLGIDSSIVKALNQAGVQTIDDLADIQLTGNEAIKLQQDMSFTENLELLQLKAKTRRRTLPDGDLDPDVYEVTALPKYSGNSQLPEHTINGERLIRIYLSVEYDYVENRIGGLSAHVTKSQGKLDPKFEQNEDGKSYPIPEVKEYIENGRDENNKSIKKDKELEGKDVIEFQRFSWKRDYREDNGAEKQLIHGFLLKLVDAIASVAETEKAPIHFYIWSRQEMSQLIEGCSRVSAQLLSHLRELLGCREGLEQLIYSCLSDEVEQGYALAWTGRDLAVVTSLKWFGRSYHWQRNIVGKIVSLDQVFSQDVFDFKTNLEIDANNQWATKSSQNPRKKHQFEIRLRYFNSLSAAYWRGYWRTLPQSEDPKTAKAIESYNQAQKSNYLTEYFKARTHAIRWIEEGIISKNSEIMKESLTIEDLPDFSLGVDDTAQAGIDFLRLDQHVKVTDWIAYHLKPPIYRVSSGRTIPVKNVRSQSNNRLIAKINLEKYNITPEALQANCTFAEGSYIKVSRSSEDPHQGQTIGQLLRTGSVCEVLSIDWDSETIELKIRPNYNRNLYTVCSFTYENGADVFDYATIDESPSDFVAGKVDEKLSSSQGNHICQWLNPEQPLIPTQNSLPNNQLALYKQFLQTIPFPDGKQLDKKQIEAIINGLNTRIQLLQGPPGTGKTETTAIATFLRILAYCSVGDIVLITAHTHTAVNNLLSRLNDLLPILQQHATNLKLNVPSIQVSRVDCKPQNVFQNTNITTFPSKPCVTTVNQMRSSGVLVIGGTTNGILKMVNELNKRPTFSRDYPQGFQTTTLIVDEASMMVFPHFLALATLVQDDGEIMLAGDHRQLAPIVTHDWDNEERPPVLLYQPYVSAYQAINNLKENTDFIIDDNQILRSTLNNTFRLPYEIRKLIEPVYLKDNIQLTGKNQNENKRESQTERNWETLLSGNEEGLYLVVHNQNQSKQINQLEVEIIKTILEAGGELPHNSTAILTPHRAQRSLLKTELKDYYGQSVDVIDTVEKVQGGERDNIIVSATASNLSAISNNVQFLLSLNRSNVAFSRVKKRLIVVVAKTLLDYIPTELEHYEEALLWKELRSRCSHCLFEDQVRENVIKVYTINYDN